MRKILLIDADSIIPNIPIMKLSTYHKNKGDYVDFMKCNLPYFPNRKKNIIKIPDIYDKVYCSVVFEGNKKFIEGNNIIFGGTGVDLTTNLPDEIEKLECDYTLYPDNDTSYGFLTRGCIRKCFFCKVPKKEGMIKKASNIDDIVRHKKVKFLDNNILALPEHLYILQDLVDKSLKCQFNQGLDIRLLNCDNSQLLSEMNYLGEYIFAFDNWSYVNLIDDKLKLLSWVKDWRTKFFVYIHPNMKIEETVNRILWLKDKKFLPYIMRDISCWGTEHSDFFVDVAAYCNQVNFFKKLSFEEFLNIRHGIKRGNNTKRIRRSANTWRGLI